MGMGAYHARKYKLPFCIYHPGGFVTGCQLPASNCCNLIFINHNATIADDSPVIVHCYDIRILNHNICFFHMAFLLLAHRRRDECSTVSYTHLKSCRLAVTSFKNLAAGAPLTIRWSWVRLKFITDAG